MGEYKRHKGLVFAAILGQCHVDVISKLDETVEFVALDMNDNVIGLLDLLDCFAHSAESNEPYWLLQAEMCRLMAISQGAEESVDHYYKRFKNLVKAVEAQWGPLHPIKLGDSRLEDRATSREYFLVRLFLSGADKRRFGILIKDLRKQYLAKTDNYPESFETTKNWLLSYQANCSGGSQHGSGNNQRAYETSFLEKGKTSSRVKCFNCKQPGHVNKDCPCLKKPDKNEAKQGSAMTQMDKNGPKSDDSLDYAWDS